jgi:hypothetical protein
MSRQASRQAPLRAVRSRIRMQASVVFEGRTRAMHRAIDILECGHEVEVLADDVDETPRRACEACRRGDPPVSLGAVVERALGVSRR